MAGPIDELKTRLSLEGNMKTEMKAHKQGANEMADAMAKAEDAAKSMAKSLEQEAAAGAKKAAKEANDLAAELKRVAKDLDDALTKRIGSLAGGAKGFSHYFDDALIAGMKTSPILRRLSGEAMELSMRMGTSLANSAAHLVTFLTSPTGIAVAAGVAAAAVVVLGNAFAFAGGALTGFVTSFGIALPGIVSTMSSVLGPALALPFIKASAEMDRYERQFTSIFGGQKQGKMVVDWMREYGLTSPLSQQSIAQLIRVIGQGGKDVGRFMPVAETLSLAGREDADTNARDIASIFMRLIGGQIADAFGPEGLGRFGINREMLGSAGAKFDKSGSFIGSTDDALAVLEKLTQTHPVLKDLRALMEDSDDTKLSNAWDAVTLAIQDAGKTFSLHLMPIIEQGAMWIRNLTQNGGVKEIAEGFAQMVGGPDGLKSIIAGSLALLKNLPMIFQAALTVVQAIAMSFKAMVLSMADVAEMIGRLPIPGAQLIGGMGQSLRKGVAGGDWLYDKITGIFTGDTFSGDYQHFMDMMSTPASSGPTSLPGSATPISPDTNHQTHPTQAIERNTKELVDAQRIVLGGKEAGRVGVTVADVFGKTGGGNRGGGASVGDRLTDIFMELAEEMIEGNNRAKGFA